MPISNIQEWLQPEELTELYLPQSRKVVGVRQVDPLSLIGEDGQVPNLLRGVLEGQANVNGNVSMTQTSAEDLAASTKFLNRLAKAVIVSPPVDDDDSAAVKAGEAIPVSFIPLADKAQILAYAVGGQAALSAVQTFPDEQASSVGAAQTSNGVPDNAEPDAADS